MVDIILNLAKLKPILHKKVKWFFLIKYVPGGTPQLDQDKILTSSLDESEAMRDALSFDGYTGIIKVKNSLKAPKIYY